MAETSFERDLQAMFDDAPGAPDAEAFVAAVDRRIGRALWLQIGLLIAFGVLGLGLSLVLAGPSMFDFSGLTGLAALARSLAAAAALDASAWSDVRVWTAGLVLLGLGLLVVRPALAEV